MKGGNRTKSDGKSANTDNKSTMTKKSKITQFTFENVEDEVKEILEEFGNLFCINNVNNNKNSYKHMMMKRKKKKILMMMMKMKKKRLFQKKN